MFPAENPLYAALQSNPEDWATRLALLDALIAGGSPAEVVRLVGEAPSAPATETELGRVVQVAAAAGHPAAALSVLGAFLSQKPSSGVAHYLMAKVLARTNELARAREHYRAAVAMNPELQDNALEAKLVDLGHTLPQSLPPVESGLAQGSMPGPVPAVPAPTWTPEPVAGEFGEEAAADEGEAEEMARVEPSHPPRLLVVCEEGDPVKVMAPRRDTSQKMLAVMVAVVLHLLLAVFFAFLAMNLPNMAPPQIVASATPVLDQEIVQQKTLEKQVQSQPVQSPPNMMEIISVVGASAVAMPAIQTDLLSLDPIGTGDSFGASMSFDAGADGGMVAFFGSRATSKKVVFAVDYSLSMKAQDKDKLMRKELAKAVNALPGGIDYQVIFFHGPAWYHEQSCDLKGDKEDKWKNYWIRADRGGGKWKWYMGPDEKSRSTGAFVALFHPEWGLEPDKLPKGEYWKSTRSNIRKSVQIIEETPLGGGTDWRWPLYMAINMQPDTIYFMTDGAFSIPSQESVVDEIIRYSRTKGRPKINTINMMVLNDRTEEIMERIAKQTGGEFSLVLVDETVLRGRELEEYRKSKAK